MDDQKEKGTWWATLPGILTGIGAILGSLAALITIIVQVQKNPSQPPPINQDTIKVVQPREPINVNPPAPPDTINVDRILPKHQYETGYIVALLGTVKDPQVNTYVVVKPANDLHWYIQPPAPVTVDGQNWTGNAYLGEQNAGIGVHFKILVITTTTTYQGQQALTSLPPGKITDTINCKRVR